MIPHIVLQTSREKPEQAHIDYLMARCVDWEYRHFVDAEIETYINDHPIAEFPDMLDKWRAFPNGAHRADFFRYLFLYLEGGVFLDSDAMIYQPITSLVKQHTIFTVQAKNPGLIFQGILGSVPRHPVIYAALYDIYHTSPANVERDYHRFCRAFKKITVGLHFCAPVKLYVEKADNLGKTAIFDDDKRTVLAWHFYRNKQVEYI